MHEPRRAEAAIDLRDGLRIAVRSGCGTGSTTLSAFDAALGHAGIANFNLIRLSSVIPPAAVIEVEPDHAPPVEGTWGDRLYVVMAECRVEAVHEQAWAGVGWVQDPATGRGLFVEHEGHARAQVEADIDSSLHDLVRTRDGAFGPIRRVVVGDTCRGEPLCALAVAVFTSEPWDAAAPSRLP